MSSTDVQRPMKVHDACVKPVTQDSDKHVRRASVNTSIPPAKKNKHDDGRFKFGRKRAQSFTAGNGKFFIPYKKRKRDSIVPPTKFLLGGNIFDPLNLNSLQDEEINRAMNAVTPKSSPLPTPKHRRGEVEVIIPPNINDPLNLIDCDDDAKYEEQLVSPTKKKSKKKKKKRNSSSSKDDSMEVPVTNPGTDVVTCLKFEEDEPQSATASTTENVSSEMPETAVCNKDVKDLKKELDLPLKDDDKKPRKTLEENLKEPIKHEKKNRKNDLKDKIVSPVIPQPGTWKRQPHGHRGGGTAGHNHNHGHGHGHNASEGRFNRFRNTGRHRSQNPGLNIAQTPKFQEKNSKFQFGNYNRYYGYRNPCNEVDLRLKYFQQRRDLFFDKDVLDIGCNIGHVTLTIARDFGAKSVVGLDIDRSLIEIARVNVRHYVNYADSPPNEGPTGRFFPISMPILYGPVDIPGITKSDSPSGFKKFPHNVSFVQGNYVLESDVLLQTEQPQFDVILALSITKWLHLNWGDAGLKRAFKRMFLQLRPGGQLILEAQAWDSYKKKKKLTETIFKNYNSIEFFPDKFTQYLLSSEVGFSKCEVIGMPFHQSRGFQRPIQLYTKGESPLHASASTAHTPCYTPCATAARAPVYATVSSLRESDSGSATPCVGGPRTPGASSWAEAPSTAPTPVYAVVDMPYSAKEEPTSEAATPDETASATSASDSAERTPGAKESGESTNDAETDLAGDGDADAREGSAKADAGSADSPCATELVTSSAADLSEGTPLKTPVYPVVDLCYSTKEDLSDVEAATPEERPNETPSSSVRSENGDGDATIELEGSSNDVGTNLMVHAPKSETDDQDVCSNSCTIAAQKNTEEAREGEVSESLENITCREVSSTVDLENQLDARQLPPQSELQSNVTVEEVSSSQGEHLACTNSSENNSECEKVS